VLQYTFVTIDDAGNDVVVAQGEYRPEVDAHEVGDIVTVPGEGGAEKSWKIIRMVPVPYGGVSFQVEPAG
jgi:hypothetical protein